jgi:hypothetical protein
MILTILGWVLLAVVGGLDWLLEVAVYALMFWGLFLLLGVKGAVEVGGALVSYPICCGVAIASLRLVVSAAKPSKERVRLGRSKKRSDISGGPK